MDIWTNKHHPEAQAVSWRFRKQAVSVSIKSRFTVPAARRHSHDPQYHPVQAASEDWF